MNSHFICIYPYINNLKIRQILTDWTAFLVSDVLPRGPYDSNQFSKEMWSNLIAKYTSKRHSGNSGAIRRDGYIPTIYHGSLESGLTHDTYIDTQGWGKGYVNVKYDDWFNLGRLVILLYSVYF